MEMPTYICSLSWTDLGARNIRSAKERRESTRQLARKLSIDIQQIYLTTGERDLLIIMEAPDDQTVAKFALATASSGNTRTSTCRAFTESEFEEIIDGIPDPIIL
jgi:uncharacterized protein with GYD domain